MRVLALVSSKTVFISIESRYVLASLEAISGKYNRVKTLLKIKNSVSLCKIFSFI